MKYATLLLLVLLVISFTAVAADKPVPPAGKAVTLYFHNKQFCALAFSELGNNPSGSVNLTYVDISQPPVDGSFNVDKLAAVPFYTSCVGYPNCAANSPFWYWDIPNVNDICSAVPPPS